MEPTPAPIAEDPVEKSTQLRSEMNNAVERYEAEIERIRQYQDAIDALEKTKKLLHYSESEGIDRVIKLIHSRFTANYSDLTDDFKDEKLEGSSAERLEEARADYEGAASNASRLMRDPEANAAIHQAALEESEDH